MSSLPNLWHFDRIAAQDAERAKALQAAPSSTEITQQVIAAMRRALINRTVRIGWEIGYAFNKELIRMLRDELAEALEPEIEVRCLNSAFDDIGSERVPRSRILESLEPEPSKVWFCRELIGHGGEVTSLLVDVSGPRLVFDEFESWAAPYADEAVAWLDLKGAFLSKSGPFQIKEPIQRAKDIQRLGSA